MNYLTHWNVVLQLFYFSLAFFNDLFGSSSSSKQKSSVIQQFQDFTFACIAFPLALFVSIMFWLFYHVDRDLVFPEEMDFYFPPMTNHMMHTTPVVSQLVELYVTYHIYPSHVVGIMTTIIFFTTYLIWICYIAYSGGPWVYGVIEVLSPRQRIGFFFASFVVAAMLFLSGDILNRLIWKKGHVIPPQKAK